ncbi:MAG: ATP-binding cassette domain-containing protein [Spirochaetia bacterium]|nr:ATP-binding cassette domain-containing protein [Spirochaetia bacterium]
MESYDLKGIYCILGAILFSKDEAEKSVSTLSGGELARLNLGKIISEKPNVLLPDEPTNHLDMESISSLEDALQNFKGTVIIVSHDKSFVSKIAQSIFEISEDGLRKFQGDYDEFLENFGTDYLNRFIVKKQKPDKTEKNQPKPPGKVEINMSCGKKKRACATNYRLRPKKLKRIFKRTKNNWKRSKRFLQLLKSLIKKPRLKFRFFKKKKKITVDY